MDPLTIAINAFSSAKTLYTVGKTLYDEVQSYRQQSHTIERFCDSTNSLCILLQSIKDFVSQQINVRNESQWLNIRNALEISLKTCHKSTDKLIGIVSKLERPGNRAVRQVRMRIMEGDLEKGEKEIDRQMSRLSLTLSLFQIYFGGASTSVAYQNALLRDFNDLVRQNEQRIDKLSPEQKHIMIAMQQRLDKSLQSPSPQSDSAKTTYQTQLRISLETWLVTAGGLTAESHDISVCQFMIGILDLVYSSDDVQLYAQPINRLYHLLDGARYKFVPRSEVRPHLIRAVSQCRFSAHSQEYIKMIGDAETIDLTGFQVLFYSLVEVSMKLEHERVECISKNSYHAGMLELELESQWKKVNDPYDSYRPAAGSPYSGETSFQYCAWALSRVWTQRLRHLAQLWRTPGNGSFSAEEETERILDLVQFTSRFGDILLVNGKLLDLLELAHERLPFDETVHKSFPHEDVQRLVPACRKIFAYLTSLVVEFKTDYARQLMQSQEREYERDFSLHRMKYINKPMNRGQWIHLGISSRLNRIMEFTGGQLTDTLNCIERCKAWAQKNPDFEKTVLGAFQVTESFQRELDDELKAKISTIRQRALSSKVTLTLTNLHLEGLRRSIFHRYRKLVVCLQVSKKVNGPQAPRIPFTQSNANAPPSWNNSFRLKLHKNDRIEITIGYESAREPLVSVSFRPSEYLDFYEGGEKNMISPGSINASLKIVYTVSVPPSSMSKQESLPRDHRPGGWIGRHTNHQPARSYHKRYLTGEYTLLDPIEKTARKTVVPMLVETMAKAPLVGGVVGAMTDQFGMASGFLYGKLWNSWK